MARPRLRRFVRWAFRWALRGGLVLAVLAVGYFIYVGMERSSARGRLAAVRAELDRTDPGWRMHDLYRLRNNRLPPDSRNPVQHVLLTLNGTAGINGVSGWNRRVIDRNTGGGQWLPEVEINRRPWPIEDADARCVRDDNLAPLDALRRVRQMPDPGGVPRDVGADPFAILLPDVQQMREAAAALQLDAVVSALHGDPDRAADAATTNLAVARGMGDGTTLIEMLVRIAISMVASGTAERVLALCEPSDPALAELQAALLAEAEASRLKPALRGERAGIDLFMENTANGTLAPGTIMPVLGTGTGIDAQAGIWVYKIQFLTADHAFTLELFNKWIAECDRPPHRRSDFEKDIPPRGIRHLFSRLLMPAVQKCMEADTRATASLRCAGAAVACERFRVKHGRWPESLAELGPLLPAVLIDPYDGKPLRYARFAGGAVVYSVGFDKQDNGGNVSYRREEGTDYGFRLWDADRRSADPPPEPDPPVDGGP